MYNIVDEPTRQVHMNKTLSLLLIISFLGVQMLSHLHMAEHGFEKHEHDGHICDIYLHAEHTQYHTPGAATVLHVPEYAATAVTITGPHVVHSERYGVASPRAPPHFS